MKDKGAAPNPKFNYNELAQKLEGAENNIRILQSFLTQMGRTMQHMQNDLTQSINLQKSMHYRVKAQQEFIASLIQKDHPEYPMEVAITQRMLSMQINDFNEESDRDDAANGYLPDDVINENSIIIITSVTPDETVDKGVLRSKVNIQDLNNEDLQKELIGKKIGDTVEVMIQNVRHVISVIAIKKAPPAPVEEVSTEVKE